MRSTIARLGTFALAALVLGRIAGAQCIQNFSDDMAQYYNESTDGTSIYTAVLIDGGAQMQISPSCAEWLPPIQHTPMADNQLSISGGQTVGGWGQGSGVCQTCYMSYENDQSIAASPGQEVNWTIQSQAVCNVGGIFFSASLFGTIGYSVGNFVNSGPGGIYTGGCLFKLSCPNNTASVCAPPSISAQGNDCNYPYDHEYYLTWTPNGGQTDCFSPNIGSVSATQIDCR